MEIGALKGTPSEPVVATALFCLDITTAIAVAVAVDANGQGKEEHVPVKLDEVVDAFRNALLEQGPGIIGTALEMPGVDLQEALPDGLQLCNILDVLSCPGAPCMRLDLSGCGIGDDRAMEIAAFILRQPIPPSEVDLHDNVITGVGLAHLCAALCWHPAREKDFVSAARTTQLSPCRLDLRGNAIARGADVLVWLADMGLRTCCVDNCCRDRCIFDAPVHLASGLGQQFDAIYVSREEIRFALDDSRKYQNSLLAVSRG